jgi:hypothetical protein
MFNMDPTMMLIKTLQEDRRRTYPRRRWSEGRTGRRTPRTMAD